ncbi:MAG: hypothetical protein KJO61_05495, partial [Deltaproteobacteria bacterium]|nr:hypothetical protein [Deltaproteobacteria bacterium]
NRKNITANKTLLKLAHITLPPYVHTWLKRKNLRRNHSSEESQHSTVIVFILRYLSLTEMISNLAILSEAKR